MLEVRNLDAFYGPAQALFGVSLRVGAGEMVVLQGLNGAGKSTLLKSLMGMEVRTRGEILYSGGKTSAVAEAVDISGWETHRRARAGLGYVAEDRRLFTTLTVRENLHIAVRTDAGGAASDSAANLEARALDLFPVLKTMLKRPAAHMSGGEQQMLAMARTLMTAPRILLLDEPCEGIAPVLVEAIRDALLALKRAGMPMLVVEQNRLLAASADKLHVLVAGKVGGR
ncbi:MAG: ABC transporter ATP-binding protein [Comamonadaceae bacterium]|nr:MAG: ABC transporter ATP-binding protein [Comamonadaceae bacterium]